MSFITNFQAPVELEELVERFNIDRQTNLDKLIHDIPTATEWTVAKDAQIGDTVFFLCAKTAVDHMGHVRKQAVKDGNRNLVEFAEAQYAMYRKYAGKILAIGTVAETPFQSDDSGYQYAHWRSPWYAVINNMILLKNPISIDSFRDFIKVSRTGAITKLNREQERQLLQIIRENNIISSSIGSFDYRIMSPIPLFDRYLELIFANDDLWNNFQCFVRQTFPDRGHEFFAYHRDPACVKIWRQMLDNMGGGIPLTLFASADFLLLDYKEQGHDLDAELAQITRSQPEEE